MNQRSAQKLEDSLRGTRVGGWTIEELLGSGMSAAVFRATNGGQTAALKIFDTEFTERDGRKSQLDRINRELNLRDKPHIHLVRIYDGGQCPHTGLLYVVMEYLPARNLFSRLKEIPREKIRQIVGQVASAAQFLLEEHETVHRDIKTDNIVVDDDMEDATLLDLGVVKPLLRSDGSDISGEEFLGTTRYAPPEFLFGQAGHSKEAF